MRITLAIDDDLLAAAKHLAGQEQKSVGQVISFLARQGLLCGPHPSKVERNGIPLLPPSNGSQAATLELVNQLRDELD